MKKLFFYFCVLFHASVCGQSICNQTVIPTIIYPPNTSTTPTSIGFNIVEYLCGPNTIVTDTALFTNCHNVYMNTGSTLNLKSYCLSIHVIFIKNNCTLNIHPNTSSPIWVFKEPGAIINDPSNIASYTTCPLITYPTVNCGITSLLQEELNVDYFKFWPNPSSSEINIQIQNTGEESNSLSITNVIGTTILELKGDINKTQTIHLDKFPSGYYFIRLTLNSGRTQTKKFNIIRE